jgi:hypothetical protein
MRSFILQIAECGKIGLSLVIPFLSRNGETAGTSIDRHPADLYPGKKARLYFIGPIYELMALPEGENHRLPPHEFSRPATFSFDTLR